MKKILITLVICFAVSAFVGCGSDYNVSGISDSIVPVSMSDDVTDSWKLTTIACDADPREYALEYYSTCFEDGDKVHWIVNFGPHTTTCIRDLGGPLSVSVYEYVDGEETSAKTIGGGTLLDEFMVNTETGEITDVQ